MWLKGKKGKKTPTTVTHQMTSHLRIVLLVTTLCNRWKMNFKSTGFGNGRGFSPSQALKIQFLFILTAAELGLPPEGRQPALPYSCGITLFTALWAWLNQESCAQSEYLSAKREQDLWDFLRLTQTSITLPWEGEPAGGNGLQPLPAQSTKLSFTKQVSIRP